MRACGIAGALCIALAASCGDPRVDAEAEVAAELRALRVALQQGAAGRPEPRDSGADRSQIVAAMAPLREVLDALASQQRELQAQQLALTQEMQRWSQLLTGALAGTQRSENEALAQRLSQLEASLQQQGARQQETEALLRGALERTADRLEDFLRRLEGAGATVPSNPPGDGKPAPTEGPKREPGAADPAKASSGGETSAPGASRGEVEPAAAPTPGPPRRSSAGWWYAVAALAALVAAFFARRIRRDIAARRPGVDGGVSAAPALEPPGLDRGVEEIWAAAALLGEAVGRLREGTGTKPPARPELPAGAAHGPDFDDVFVLDDGPAAAEPPAPPPERPSFVPRRVPAGTALVAPPAMACSVPAADPVRAAADVLRLLAEDPRVLRRPEPAVAVRGNRLEVTCSVLPGLPAGEQSHLEQRIRDAVA